MKTLPSHFIIAGLLGLLLIWPLLFDELSWDFSGNIISLDFSTHVGFLQPYIIATYILIGNRRSMLLRLKISFGIWTSQPMLDVCNLYYCSLHPRWKSSEYASLPEDALWNLGFFSLLTWNQNNSDHQFTHQRKKKASTLYIYIFKERRKDFSNHHFIVTFTGAMILASVF